MKNKVVKKVIVFALLSVMTVTLLGICACQKDEDTQPSGNIVPQYATIKPAYLRRISYERIENWNWDDKKNVEIITSLSRLEEEFNILGTGYADEFFEDSVVMLIKFIYISGEENIEFKNIAIKDNKFYPIFAINTLLPNQPSSGMYFEINYIIEVNKNVLEYEFAEILVTDRRDINLNSSRYKSITSVFK